MLDVFGNILLPFNPRPRGRRSLFSANSRRRLCGEFSSREASNSRRDCHKPRATAMLQPCRGLQTQVTACCEHFASYKQLWCLAITTNFISGQFSTQAGIVGNENVVVRCKSSAFP